MDSPEWAKLLRYIADWRTPFEVIANKAGEKYSALMPGMASLVEANCEYYKRGSFGARTVNGADEATPIGKQVLYQVQANFEFIRRYMEQGTGALPKVERYLPRGPSLRASMSVWFYGIGAVGSAGGVMRCLTILLSGPIFVLSILHYIAQLTSREPVWPTEIEAACGNSASTAMAQA